LRKLKELLDAEIDFIDAKDENVENASE